jgi:hypothetical protein
LPECGRAGDIGRADAGEQGWMKVREISFREWVICRVRRLYPANTPPETNRTAARPKVFIERSGKDRRAEESNGMLRAKDWRRRPERRLPEVSDSSFEEFDRWKK